MSELLLLVRVAERSGALERVLGLVRRRVLAVRRLSVAAADGAIELALRLDTTRTPPERLKAELFSLADVLAVADGAAPGASGEGSAEPTREMAIVRLLPGGQPRLRDGWRVLTNGAAGVVLEITGSPEDVDAAVAGLRAEGLVAACTRTGEVAVPRADAGTWNAE